MNNIAEIAERDSYRVTGMVSGGSLVDGSGFRWCAVEWLHLIDVLIEICPVNRTVSVFVVLVSGICVTVAVSPIFNFRCSICGDLCLVRTLLSISTSCHHLRYATMLVRIAHLHTHTHWLYRPCTRSGWLLTTHLLLRGLSHNFFIRMFHMNSSLLPNVLFL